MYVLKLFTAQKQTQIYNKSQIYKTHTHTTRIVIVILQSGTSNCRLRPVQTKLQLKHKQYYMSRT